ncbi:MAG: hypothetical protein IT428_16265 [Planctomycetaceae bacterium]|nr:hypothetical protein [Planctomycetaceae bacterium]
MKLLPLLLAAGLLAGCSDGKSGHAAIEPMVYVDTETGKVVQAPPEPTPAVNPDTGKKTLMPGLYCSRCKKWYPSAPLEVAQRNPSSRMCPKHRTPMETKGPVSAP